MDAYSQDSPDYEHVSEPKESRKRVRHGNRGNRTEVMRKYRRTHKSAWNAYMKRYMKERRALLMESG